jgi:hypothetical protein
MVVPHQDGRGSGVPAREGGDVRPASPGASPWREAPRSPAASPSRSLRSWCRVGSAR